MRKTIPLALVALCTLMGAAPLAAATYTTIKDGNWWCESPAGDFCAFGTAGHPGAADKAVVQHAASVIGAATEPKPEVIGSIDMGAGTFGIYGGMRIEFGGGTWSGGALDSCCNGGGTFDNQGLLTVNAAFLPAYRAALENNGTLRVASGAALVWNQGNGAGSIANLTTGPTPALLELAGSAQLGGVLTVNNEGVLRKSGAGMAAFYGKLRNLGTSLIEPGSIEVQQGTLAIADANGYEALLITEGGHIDVAQDALLAIRDGGQWRPVPESPATQVYTTTGSGAGHVRLEAGGTLLGALDFAGGRGAVLDFEPGVFEWRGGSMTGNGVRNDGEITIAGPDAKLLDGFYLDNAGTIKLQVPLPMAGRLWTLAGGLLEASDGTGVAAGGNNPSFIVDGTLRKLAGPGTFTIADMNLHGNGLVEINGGHFALTEGASFYSMSDFTGTLNLVANATVDDTGVLLIDQNAKLTGVGSINTHGAEQRGRIEPGAPFGAIQMAGDRLYQANESSTRISIGGTIPLTQTAQLQVLGDLYPNSSTLRVNFRDGFSPNAGDSFDLITVGGVFGTGIGYNVVIEGLAPGFQYTLTQSPQKTVRLTALNHVLSLAEYMFSDSFEN